MPGILFSEILGLLLIVDTAWLLMPGPGRDMLDKLLLVRGIYSTLMRGRNAYYALKNPCPSLQDESESSSLCKKRKTSQIQPPISLKDSLVWPKVKDADCTEINMI